MLNYKCSVYLLLHSLTVTMDLRRLLRLLHDVRAKWYDIGIQLSISIGTLDAIKAEHSECGKCLCEMLKYWLNTQQPTFDALIEALSSEPVGENTLAENTRDLHLTVTSDEGMYMCTRMPLVCACTGRFHIAKIFLKNQASFVLCISMNNNPLGYE